MRIVLLAAAAVSVAGCWPLPFDVGSDCGDVAGRYQDVLDGLDRSCDTAADCEVIGGADDCDVSVCLPEGIGNKASVDAARDELADLGRQLENGTCEEYLGCDADLGPSGASCVQHECQLVINSCLPVPTCGEELGWYREAVRAVDRSCVVDDDCLVIGAAQSCECVVALFGEGLAVNAAAYAHAGLEGEANDILDEAGGCPSPECGNLACTCGVGPVHATCSSGTCAVVRDQFCAP